MGKKASELKKARRAEKDAQKMAASVSEESDVEEKNVNVCNVDSGENYKISMTDFITEILASGRVKGQLLKLILRSTQSNKKDVTLLFDCRSLYFVGFEIDGVKFEFGKFNDSRILDDSRHLGYREQYSQFCNLSKVQVGHKPLKNAFKQITNFRGVKDKGFSNWLEEIKPGLATIVVMFSEGSRFTWVYDRLESVVTGEATADEEVITLVDDWMCDTFPFWSKISRVARDGGVGDANENMPVPQLPPRPRVYTCQDVTNAKEYQIWADDLINIENPDIDDDDDS
ncbi:eukaryotic translation initiation factor 3 subunit A-like protein [Tanacetum coccineum]